MELDRSVLAGALTMALLVMPIIIVSAQEALRAVPPSMREGAYALGATRWQMIRTSVLPFAFGGTMTGTILAMSRAIGETAPLLVIGGLTFVAFLPSSPTDSFTILSDPDLQLGVAATGGLPDDRGGGDSDAAAAATAAEQHGDHSAPAHAGALVAGRGAIRWWKLESVRKKPTTS